MQTLLLDGSNANDPLSAQVLLAKPFIPNWMYKLFGGYGWRQSAKQYGVQKELKRQPYL
jgi:hypothetical protein